MLQIDSETIVKLEIVTRIILSSRKRASKVGYFHIFFVSTNKLKLKTKFKNKIHKLKIKKLNSEAKFRKKIRNKIKIRNGVYRGSVWSKLFLFEKLVVISPGKLLVESSRI